jgi:hypothetical protein
LREGGGVARFIDDGTAVARAGEGVQIATRLQVATRDRAQRLYDRRACAAGKAELEVSVDQVGAEVDSRLIGAPPLLTVTGEI